MKMNAIVPLTGLILAVIFQGCNNVTPKERDVVGIWKSSEGAVFEFRKNGQFTSHYLPGEIIFFPSDEFNGKRFSETGKWKIKEWQGQWVVELSFNKSPTLNKGFDTRLLISGNREFYNLFVWQMCDTFFK